MRTRKVETVSDHRRRLGPGPGRGRKTGAAGAAGSWWPILTANWAREAADLITDGGGKAAKVIRWMSPIPQSVAELFSPACAGSMQRLDMLVHTAGILGRTVLLDEMGDSGVAANDGGQSGRDLLLLPGRHWPAMKPDRRGAGWSSFSSVAALTPTPGAIHYSVGQGGGQHAGQVSGRAEAAPHNVQGQRRGSVATSRRPC